MKYLIIRASSVYELEQRVQDHLDNNWELQGGATAAGDLGVMVYLQALVRND